MEKELFGISTFFCSKWKFYHCFISAFYQRYHYAFFFWFRALFCIHVFFFFTLFQCFSFLNFSVKQEMLTKGVIKESTCWSVCLSVCSFLYLCKTNVLGGILESAFLFVHLSVCPSVCEIFIILCHELLLQVCFSFIKTLHIH